ncbi:MAG: hypothetical protein CL663_02560 [Bacteroidetes bacterium]|nr:hypothetical protein [Bacteroidota bacterium]
MRKLKQSLLLVLLVLMSNIFTQSVQAQDKVDVDKWLITSPFELKMPVFNNDHDVNGNEFTIKSLLTYKHVERSLFWPENGDIFQMNAKKSEWKIGEVEDENQVKVLKSKKIKGIQVAYATHYVEVDRWMNAKLEISSTYAFEVMLDGKVIGKKTSLDKDLNTFSKSVELEQGKHIVVVKMIVKEGHDKDLNISAKYSVEEPATTANLIASISPKRRMDISHVLDGPRVGSLVASPDASYYIVRFSERYAPEGDNSSWYEIYETGSNQMVVSLKGMDLWNLNWIPGSNKLSYITNDLSGSKIVSFDFEKRYSIRSA